jgi:heme exporter protein A
VPPEPAESDASEGFAPTAVVPVLDARGLVREYGPVVAVAGIDLHLAAGEFLSVFGPNGAGKSSLLGMLSGALRPTRGTVRVEGVDLASDGGSWRRHVGVLSHRDSSTRSSPPRRTSASTGPSTTSPTSNRVPERLEQVGLEGKARARVRELSHGMRQRLSLARALLHDPRPRAARRAVHRARSLRLPRYSGASLTELRDGERTVVMVTHNLHEGLEMATRVAVQVGGRFAWEGTRADAGADFEHVYHRVVEERS